MAPQKRKAAPDRTALPNTHNNVSSIDQFGGNFKPIGDVAGPLILASGKLAIERHVEHAADRRTSSEQAAWHLEQASRISLSMEAWGKSAVIGGAE